MKNELKGATKCKSSNNAGKPYHHGDLYQTLLCAAGELLEANNIASLSLRTVAKQVGVSHNAPYRHFQDKESLLVALASQGFDNLSTQMHMAMSRNPENPTTQLKDAGLEYVRLAIRHPQRTQLMFSDILPRDGTYPEFEASGNSAFEGLKLIISVGQAHGVFKKGNKELLALTAWSSVHGLSSILIGGKLHNLLNTQTDYESITSAVVNNILDGIRAQ